MKKKLAFMLSLALLLTALVFPAMAAQSVPRVVIDGQEVTFDAVPLIDKGRIMVPLRAIFEQMGAKVDWDDAAKTATAVKDDITVVVKLGSTAPTVNGEVINLDVPAKLVEGGRILAPLRFVCEAFGGAVAWDSNNYIAAVDTSGTLPGEQAAAAPKEMTLTLQQAVDLAVENNPQVQLVGFERDKKSVEYARAQKTSHNLENTPDNPPYYSSSAYKSKLAIYLAPKIAERQSEQAEQVYAITVNGIKIQVESAFYDLIKARENEKIAENALQRAQEQLRIANSKYSVGTVAKIEVTQNEAAQAAAQAALTSARSNSRQKMLELNKLIGLEMTTVVNPAGVFEFKAEVFHLPSLLDKAAQESLAIITARNNYDIASWSWDFVVSYYGSGNWDAQLAKEDANATRVLLQQAEAGAVTAVNQTYANYQALEEQYQYLSKAVELSREAYRLRQLSYEVGMTTFEDVQKASDDLQKAEAALSECIYHYNTVKSAMKYNIYG